LEKQDRECNDASYEVLTAAFSKICSFYVSAHEDISLIGCNASDTRILGYPEERNNNLFRNIGVYLSVYTSSRAPG
jgi:hypothetical protein